MFLIKPSEDVDMLEWTTWLIDKVGMHMGSAYKYQRLTLTVMMWNAIQ